MKCNYVLELANNQGWSIIATEGTHLWLKKFASIMELKTSSQKNHPKLIFIKRRIIRDGYVGLISGLDLTIQNLLPKKGWKKFYKSSMFGLWHHKEVKDILFEFTKEDYNELNFSRMQQSLFYIYQQAMLKGGIPFHCGFIELNSNGFLLVATSNIGKSTCCHRIPSPWKALSDDYALAVLNNRQYFVHPFPTWSLLKSSEQTWNTQYHVPLSAIFFIEQAKSDKVIPIKKEEAALRTYRVSLDPLLNDISHISDKDERMFKNKLFENSCELVKTIPTFILRVSLKGKFWKKIEKSLKKYKIMS